MSRRVIRQIRSSLDLTEQIGRIIWGVWSISVYPTCPACRDHERSIKLRGMSCLRPHETEPFYNLYPSPHGDPSGQPISVLLVGGDTGGGGRQRCPSGPTPSPLRSLRIWWSKDALDEGLTSRRRGQVVCHPLPSPQPRQRPRRPAKTARTRDQLASRGTGVGGGGEGFLTDRHRIEACQKMGKWGEMLVVSSQPVMLWKPGERLPETEQENSQE